MSFMNLPWERPPEYDDPPDPPEPPETRSRTMTLYDLTSQQLALIASIGDGEMDERTAARAAYLDDATGEKLDGYLAVRSVLTMWIDQAQKEAAEWQAKVAELEKELADHDGKLRLHLERHGMDRTRTAKGRVISLQFNGGLVPLEFETGSDPSTTALEFVRTRTATEWDREKIRATLDSGVELPFVRLGQRGRRLVIK